MLAQSIDALKRQAVREGRAEGRAEGKQEGKIEGKQEGKREVARTMLADGLPVDKISYYTGLTTEEILQLKQQPGRP